MQTKSHEFLSGVSAPTPVTQLCIKGSNKLSLSNYIYTLYRDTFNIITEISQSCQLCEGLRVFLLPPRGDIMTGHKSLEKILFK